MSKRDYYEVLGVSQSADKDDLKRAFRKLAQQYHPDINKEPDAETKFKEINEAYQVLNDDQKRAAYDRFGHAGVEGAGGFGDFSGGFGDLGSIFEEIFSGFGGPTSSRRRRNAPQRGADLRVNLTLSFEEAAFGIERELEVPRQEACDRCQGSGAEPGTQPTRCGTCSGAGEVRRQQQSALFGAVITTTTCPTCAGSGEIIPTPCNRCKGGKRVRITRTLNVNIPAGVDEGTRIRLANEGESGHNGGPAGNLYVEVTVEPHAVFVRDGFDVHLEYPLNFSQVALGAAIRIPTIDGKEETLDIPGGTQTGRTFRLRGLGVPRLQRSGRGDMLITAKIMTPTKLSTEQRDLLRELAKTFDDETTEQNKGFFDRLFGG